jgi:hypothetical protein
VKAHLLLPASWAAIFLLTVVRLLPPAPRPTTAPTERFSAQRAKAVLAGILREGSPHTVGSAENARVRERIVDVFRQLGYSPTVESQFACDRRGCGTVENILARLPGAGKRVLLAAHYDSVGAGPGAGDDGMGVATLLETARALKAGPPLPRPVLFLIDDGEEAGLLGATGFLAASPEAKEVGAVVNVDSRGTTGPSLMFETSGDNAFLVGLLAWSMPRPVTSSIFSTIYERLPNDTDLSVFKPRGTPGLNFANIGEVTHYHTPLDDLRHMDPGTLQHHGDHVLALARALARADLEHPRSGNAVFFDVLALLVVSFGVGAALPMAIAALVTMIVLAIVLNLGRRECGLGLLAALVVPLLGGCAGLLVRGALALTGAAPRPFVAHPTPALLAFWSAGLLGAALGLLLLGRRTRPDALWAGTWVVWGLAGVALARRLPGASYPFLVPSALAALVGVYWAVRPDDARRFTLAAAIPSGAAALLLAPLIWVLYDAVGIPGTPGVSVLLAAVAFTGAPLVPWKRSFLLVPLGGMALGLLWAPFREQASPQRPERMSILFTQEAESRNSEWIIAPESGRLPEAVAHAAPFSNRPEPLPPWSSLPSFQAVAEGPPLPAPELLVEEQGTAGSKRTVRGRIVSRRGAPSVWMVFPEGFPLLRLTAEGQEAELRPGRGGYRVFRCVTTPPEGIEVVLELKDGPPADLRIADLSPGLPPSAATLLLARPAWAVPSQGGDTTVVIRRIRI